MKRVLGVSLVLLFFASIIVSCNKSIKNEEISSTTSINKVEEETSKSVAENEIIQSVNKTTENTNKHKADIKFSYTGDDAYISAICGDMQEEASKYFSSDNVVEIPTPYIVKVDEADENNMKVFGNFYIYGYELNGSIFDMKNGGSFPGCYHLNKENDNIYVVSREIAEDGSKNYESLVSICEGDENLAKEILSIRENDEDDTRIKYVKMYANNNDLKITGIKDYGWPVILFDNITDAEFVYDFYDAYFKEIRQDDVLNDMVERIDNLKNKYMDSELIKKMEEKSSDMGSDMIINAQDVSDEMINTLQVDDFGSGKLQVSYNKGGEDITKIYIKISAKGANRKIIDINY